MCRGCCAAAEGKKEHATRMHVRGTGLLRSVRGVCAAAVRQRHPWGLVSLWGCVQRKVRRARRRAGSGQGALGGAHSQGGARRAMCYAAVLPGFARSPRAERLWTSSLLAPATQHGAGCGVQVCGGVGSRCGWRGCLCRWCAAQGGPCAAARLCVGRRDVVRRNAARAVTAEKRVPSAPVPPRPRATSGGPTLCVRHTTRCTLWGVQLVRQGWSWVRERGGACATQGRPTLVPEVCTQRAEIYSGTIRTCTVLGTHE